MTSNNVTKWIHIDEPRGNFWVQRIYSSLHKNLSCLPIEKELAETGIHLTTRLIMLRRIIERLHIKIDNLHKEILKEKSLEDYIYTLENEGYAFRINEDLKYGIIIDIDSYLHCLAATLELMCEFFVCLYKQIGQPISKKQAHEKIKVIIDSNSSNWIKEFKDYRNYFTHNAAPYFAVDMSSEAKPQLIVMKENIADFSDNTKFVALRQLFIFSQNFTKSAASIQSWLIDMLEKNSRKLK